MPLLAKHQSCCTELNTDAFPHVLVSWCTIQAPLAAGELVIAGIESRVAAASAVAAVCSEMATCSDHDGELCCPPQHLASDAIRALLTALRDYTVDNRCSHL